jgi:ABC-type Na+ transport system ATPase subunit NatA
MHAASNERQPDGFRRQLGVDSETGSVPAPMPAVETPEFAAMMARMARAWSRRVAQADTYDLAEMIEFGRTFEDAIAAAIRGGREVQPEAFSWSAIGEAAGISRQAAQQRWGKR